MSKMYNPQERNIHITITPIISNSHLGGLNHDELRVLDQAIRDANICKKISMLLQEELQKYAVDIEVSSELTWKFRPCVDKEWK